MLLGRPWHIDKKVIYDGRENNLTFEKDGRRHTLLPLKDENPNVQVNPRVMLVGGKDFLHKLKETKINYVVVSKPKLF